MLIQAFVWPGFVPSIQVEYFEIWNEAPLNLNTPSLVLSVQASRFLPRTSSLPSLFQASLPMYIDPSFPSGKISASAIDREPALELSLIASIAFFNCALAKSADEDVVTAFFNQICRVFVASSTLYKTVFAP